MNIELYNNTEETVIVLNDRAIINCNGNLIVIPHDDIEELYNQVFNSKTEDKDKDNVQRDYDELVERYNTLVATHDRLNEDYSKQSDILDNINTKINQRDSRIKTLEGERSSLLSTIKDDKLLITALTDSNNNMTEVIRKKNKLINEQATKINNLKTSRDSLLVEVDSCRLECSNKDEEIKALKINLTDAKTKINILDETNIRLSRENRKLLDNTKATKND